jgi:thiol-disulfide isomerase/thioredoxin
MEYTLAVIAVIIIVIYLLMPATPKSTIMWFYSENCGHCTRMDPAWKQFVAMAPNHLTIKKIDIEENQQMAMDYGVNGVPFVVKECDGKRSVYGGDRSAMDIYKFATATF